MAAAIFLLVLCANDNYVVGPLLFFATVGCAIFLYRKKSILDNEDKKRKQKENTQMAENN